MNFVALPVREIADIQQAFPMLLLLLQYSNNMDGLSLHLYIAPNLNKHAKGIARKKYDR